MIILPLLLATILAAPVPPAPVPLESFLLQVGVWVETPRAEDSTRLRLWADSLIQDLNNRLAMSGLRLRAKLNRLQSTPKGSLPLAGGDPRHHPDLRATSLDLMWGVRSTDGLADAGALALRTWLGNCGCLDERTFVIGWDQFLIASRRENRLDPPIAPPANGIVRSTSWSLLPDSGLPTACRVALARIRAGGGPRYSDAKRLTLVTDTLLSKPLVLEARDAEGRPAVHALLELWRGHPSASRPYGNLIEGAPDTLVSDSLGRIVFPSARTWLCGADPWSHGRNGSCGTSYWRLGHAHRKLSDWMDAGMLIGLPDTLDSLRLALSLPSGSSRSWKEASDHWPHPWLAAEADSAGKFTIGISVPTQTEYVLRVIDDQGRETARTHPMRFEPGVYEKQLSFIPVKRGWDVRLDAPSSRLQTRITQR